MGADKAILIAVGLIITVLISATLLMIYRSGSGMTQSGLSQAANLSKEFSDIDKQKYDKMTLTGDGVVSAIATFWEDPTCEVVVCTLDGVNAVYNMESSDGSYAVPFNEVLGGMPTSDSRNRAFPQDISINDLKGITKSSYKNADVGNCDTYDVSVIGEHNISGGKANGNAIIVDAAKLVQGPGSINRCLATPTGYNSLLQVGSGGYISSSATFKGSIQKDSNGIVRRITFVQQ